MENSSEAAQPKVVMKDFGMDRKKNEMGSLSVDTRRVSTENAPVSAFCETPKDTSQLFAEPPSEVLRHVAIIMDGNGRWAERRGLARSEGHFEGAKRVLDLMDCFRLFNIRYVTLYAFSTENWKRSREEVDYLMQLLADFLDENKHKLIEKKIRLLVTGRMEGLPPFCVERLRSVIEESSKNYEYTLILALNYGGRLEIADAVRKIAVQVKDGLLAPDDIDESVISKNLYLPDVPDPDLMIRTSGEQRLSNFLLWQLSYAEFYFTDVLWPDFNSSELEKALTAYKERNRRFGGRP